MALSKEKMIRRLFLEMYPLLAEHFRLRADCKEVHKTLKIQAETLSSIRVIESSDYIMQAKMKEAAYKRELEEMKKEDPEYFRKQS